jgi:predicted transcriptional regulator
MAEPTNNDILNIAGQITAAYIAKNEVPLEQVSSLLTRIYNSLKDTPKPVSSRISPPLLPAVPIEESVTEDHIICLEDGKKLQMLRRHLSTVYGMTPEQYKERWGLPQNYPVVAPSYAKRRSQIAKTTGLGLTGRKRRFSVVDGGSEDIAI